MFIYTNKLQDKKGLMIVEKPQNVVSDAFIITTVFFVWIITTFLALKAE